jgi:hypothetical protein
MLIKEKEINTMNLSCIVYNILLITFNEIRNISKRYYIKLNLYEIIKK